MTKIQKSSQPYDNNSLPPILRDSARSLSEGQEWHYLELHDQSANPDRKTPKKPLYPSCASGFMVGDCPKGHRYLRIQLCGKEWCSHCGEKWSWVHQRSYYRLLPRLEALAKEKNSIGYMVITVPPAIRQWMLNRENLASFRRYVIEFFKRQGYDKGVRVWHWSGEDGKTWHPHLNLLFSEKFISKRKLKGWRELFTAWLEQKSGISIPGKTVVINYQYSNKSGKQRHWLRYVVRATLRRYNPVICAVIKGNHNKGTWGKWSKKKQQNDIAMLEQGRCPHPKCGGMLSWSFEPLDSFARHMNNFKLISAGYWVRKEALLPYDPQAHEPRLVPKIAPRYVPLEFNFIYN